VCSSRGWSWQGSGQQARQPPFEQEARKATKQQPPENGLPAKHRIKHGPGKSNFLIKRVDSKHPIQDQPSPYQYGPQAKAFPAWARPQMPLARQRQRSTSKVEPDRLMRKERRIRNFLPVLAARAWTLNLGM